MQNLGSIALFTGNVTSLDKLPLSPSELAESIGFGARRLAQGYWILLLKQQLSIDDFELDTTTLRSGGRAGLPADTWEAEPLRLRERDRMLAEYGPEGYRHRKQHALGAAKTIGKMRIAKVLPVTRFNKNDGSPKDQFPPGWGAALQWDIVRECRFLVALKVDSDGIATAPTFSARLVPLVSQDREKIARYLENA
jgi:hypothetical protein